MSEGRLSEGAKRLWRWLAQEGAVHPVTAPGCRAADGWLAEALGVTERTIRRYRAALAAAGILREQLNAHNAMEFRLMRLPDPPHPAPTPLGMDRVEALLVRLVRERLATAIPEAERAALNLLLTTLPDDPPRDALSQALSPAGQGASQSTVRDGTRDGLSHQVEDNPSYLPLLINPSPPPPSAAPPPATPRHQLREAVEAYGVFPDAAHAIANKMAQAGYTATEATQLLQALWQETRGQVGLLVYRLTKRPLPPHDELTKGTRRPAIPEREQRTKHLFREMLE
jgi:hypothetical protein